MMASEDAGASMCEARIAEFDIAKPNSVSPPPVSRLGHFLPPVYGPGRPVPTLPTRPWARALSEYWSVPGFGSGKSCFEGKIRVVPFHR